MCPEWRDSFEAFLRDMGPRPKGCSIDRIDNTRGYEPGNCRWATPTEQANNQRKNRRFAHDGLTLTLPEWSRRTGLARLTLFKRIVTRGWSVERALTTPVK